MSTASYTPYVRRIRGPFGRFFEPGLAEYTVISEYLLRDELESALAGLPHVKTVKVGGPYGPGVQYQVKIQMRTIFLWGTFSVPDKEIRRRIQQATNPS